MDHNKNNRTITGSWGGETISRPKTIGERHQSHKGLALDRAKISKEEMNAKFRAAQIKRAGGADKFKASIESSRAKILSHMKSHTEKEMSNSEKTNYQHKVGRAYSE